MPRKTEQDCAAIVSSYYEGDSVAQLARQHNVSRQVIYRVLRDEGVMLRTASEQESIKWARMSPEQRAAQVRAAHRAATGRVRSREERLKAAATREARCTHVWGGEESLLLLCRGLGYAAMPQKAVDVYNVDIALTDHMVALEVVSNTPHVRGVAEMQNRSETITGLGWRLVYILTYGGRGKEFSAALIDAALKVKPGHAAILTATGQPTRGRILTPATARIRG